MVTNIMITTSELPDVASLCDVLPVPYRTPRNNLCTKHF